MTKASFPMYWREETRDAWNAFWKLIAQELKDQNIGASEKLSEPSSLLEHWLSPDLVLSQTCSLPFRTTLKGRVRLLGSLDFGIQGCEPGYYHSVLVMQNGRDPGDWSGLRLAYNAADSQSGWAAPIEYAEGIGQKFLAGLETGSHQNSARAVVDGKADIAAIDAQTFRLLQRYDVWVENLVVVANTRSTPGLPLISSMNVDGHRLKKAIRMAIEGMPEDDRCVTDIRSFCGPPEKAYLSLPLPPAPADYFSV